MQQLPKLRNPTDEVLFALNRLYKVMVKQTAHQEVIRKHLRNISAAVNIVGLLALLAFVFACLSIMLTR